MTIDRRSLLKGLGVAGVSAAVAPSEGEAYERKEAPADAVGMLYDTTRCIGCKACVVACHEANDLEPETANFPDGLYDAPIDLSGSTKNIIKLYQEGEEQSYMKAQCMHCLDPSCVSACMIGALQKRDYGIVTWEADRCIGCRYCQVACPFQVPKFEWYDANPKIVKCEMCLHLIKQGGGPACCKVCPREAVVFGPYEELLADANQRLADHPDRYVPKIYGEHDGGGSQVLYLSHVDFDKLGLPKLGEDAPAEQARSVQHMVYKGFIAPAALYAILGAVLWRNRRQSAADEEG